MKRARPFTSHVKMMVLTLTLPHTNRWFYQREIQLITGISNTPIRASLIDLEAFGIVLRREHGNRQYYTINPDFLMYEEYKNIVFKTTGLGDHLRWIVRNKPDQILAAFVYGGAAGKVMPPEQPIQFCCVGDISEADLQKAVANASKRTEKTYKYVRYATMDFAARRRKNDPELAKLLAGDKIFVVGRPENLETLQPRDSKHP